MQKYCCADVTAQRLGRAQPVLFSAALRIRREYLNLKCFNPYPFIECVS